MEREDAGDTGERIEGLSLDEAVDVVVAESDERDRDTARSTLGRVTADGVVSREGVDEAVSEASTAVTTAEARTDLASIDLTEVRDVAEPVTDIDAAASRLAELESRLGDVEDRADELKADFRALVDRRDDADFLELATDIGNIRAEAAGVQGTADELDIDIKAFGHWVVNPTVRYREFEEDLDAIEDWLDELADAVELLAEDADGTDGPPGREADRTDLGTVWFDAELHRRLLDLLLADLRSELADLRELADRGEVEAVDDVDHAQHLADCGTRIDDNEERLAALATRLDDLARPDWRGRFDERLAAFDAALAEYEPPVDWGELGGTFERYRPSENGA